MRGHAHFLIRSAALFWQSLVAYRACYILVCGHIKGYRQVYVILIPQARVLCPIYTHKPEGACIYVYQAKHEYLWYKFYVLHYPCSPPIQGGNQDLLYRPLGKIRLWACICKQKPPLYLRLSTKMGKFYGKREFL